MEGACGGLVAPWQDVHGWKTKDKAGFDSNGIGVITQRRLELGGCLTAEPWRVLALAWRIDVVALETYVRCVEHRREHAAWGTRTAYSICMKQSWQKARR